MRTLLAMALASGILLTFSGCGSDCGTSYCAAPAPRIQAASACNPCDTPVGMPSTLTPAIRPVYGQLPENVPANYDLPFNGI